MDRFITALFLNFQPILMLTALALCFITRLSHPKLDNPYPRYLAYFLCFPVAIYAAWTFICLFFFPSLSALIHQTVTGPFENQAATLYLGLFAATIYSLAKEKENSALIIAFVTPLFWGNAFISVSGHAYVSGHSLHTLTQVALPAVLIFLQSKAKRESSHAEKTEHKATHSTTYGTAN